MNISNVRANFKNHSLRGKSYPSDERNTIMWKLKKTYNIVDNLDDFDINPVGLHLIAKLSLSKL